MFDIITFGSASKDITIRPKNLTVLKYKREFDNDQSIIFPVGSKLEVDNIEFNTGGGGSNTAATFALQGLKTAFCGMVGNDVAGQEIINELKKLKVNTSLIFRTDKKPTNQSVVILNEQGDRTILAYRGASDLLNKKVIPFKKLKTKWIYLAPLCDSLCNDSEYIIKYAYDKRIKIALNPSMQQLSMPKEEIIETFKKIDVLFLNQEEASFLTKIPFEKEEEIFKKIDQMCPCIVVMTKGKDGAVVSDGKCIYSAKPNPSRKIIDTTGAGDSFAAGFLTDYIRSNGDIEKAIQLGMANSEGCLSKIGAKKGLLAKGQKFYQVEVSKKKI